ncbi:hypothetical protein RchiOBHm_Chr4g0403021 [Rosa chinensis]|uniref:Uncharacterized protein n=1 Tax=Rosa chinensis TaxID=74649 RepID=A0A2P6QTM1_ROSCH|nr:hypothetical protein RchiOBHm_Chr4g0403021 [Rosa chinensis]
MLHTIAFKKFCGCFVYQTIQNGCLNAFKDTDHNVPKMQNSSDNTRFLVFYVV